MQSYWRSPASPCRDYFRYWRIKKIVHVVLSGGCWKDTLSNYWRDQQDIFRSLGLLIFTSRTLLSLYLIYKNKLRNLSIPRGRKHHLHSSIQSNNSRWHWHAELPFAISWLRKVPKKCVLCNKQKQHGWNSCDMEACFSVVIYKLFFPVVSSFIN